MAGTSEHEHNHVHEESSGMSLACNVDIPSSNIMNKSKAVQGHFCFVTMLTALSKLLKYTILLSISKYKDNLHMVPDS